MAPRFVAPGRYKERHVSDPSGTDHDAIIEMLPDYAVGALDNWQQSLVAQHLEGCAQCRDDLDLLLTTVGLLSDPPAPSASVRANLLAAVDASWPEVVLNEPETPVSPAPSETPPTPAVDVGPRPLPDPPNLIRPRRWSAGPLMLGLVAGLALLAVSLGIWNVLLQQDVSENRAVAHFLENVPGRILDDSVLSPPASGVVYADPERRDALIVAHGLPPLPSDQRYQVWLFTPSGDRVSGGLFDVNDQGIGQALLEAPQPLAAYVALGLSAEPASGSPAPTTPLSLGGWLR